jgi:cytochrome c oxidase subunit 2
MRGAAGVTIMWVNGGRTRLVGVVLLCGLVLALASAVTRATAAQPRVVRITAERFTFTPAEVTVAPGTEIEFVLTSEDTLHGFRILGQSVDVSIPKRGRGDATVRFTPPAEGRYTFECSRMCGAGHSFMRGTIRVVAPRVGQ